MFSQVDNRNGVYRGTWQDVSEKVKKASSEFAELINKLSPGKDFPIYLLYLPYGMLKGDTHSSFLPTMEGGFCKLSDTDLPRVIKDELGYGKNSSPLGMILENEIEYFIEIDDEIYPYETRGPGYIFNKAILLNRKSSRNYSPNGVLKASSGARTCFLIPSINSYNNIMKLGNAIGAKISPPKRLSDHWEIFKIIANKSSSKSDWRVCLLYFSEKWVNSISQDSAWIEVKTYIMDHDRIKNLYNQNNIFYEIFFSQTQKKHNLITTNPYITNTAIHLIKIALGEMAGYIPAIDNRSLPLKDLHYSFNEFYDLDSHPTIMIPYKYQFEIDKLPVYYSLQYPTMPSSSIKRNDRISANMEIMAIEYILPSFIEALNSNESLLKNTIFDEVARKIRFRYFHNVPCGNSIILNSNLLPQLDSRFLFSDIINNKKFCHEGKFLRGCIEISNN